MQLNQVTHTRPLPTCITACSTTSTAAATLPITTAPNSNWPACLSCRRWRRPGNVSGQNSRVVKRLYQLLLLSENARVAALLLVWVRARCGAGAQFSGPVGCPVKHAADATSAAGV